jgi:hypothetical protein
MWTETAREQYRREDLRYASDMTDAEWALIEPPMPEQKALGRPPEGLWEKVNFLLVQQARERDGRDASPSLPR